MNIIFKIIIFSVLLNFSAGIMEILVNQFNSAEDGSKFSIMYYNYDSKYTGGFENNMKGAINPSSSTQDQTSMFIRIIDSLNIGIIGKFLTMINQFFYGFIDFIRCFLVQWPEVKEIFDPIEIIFKSIITIMYIIGGIYLWTGRLINK